MFGSDWSTCNVGGPGAELAWRYWREVVEKILSAPNLADDEKFMVWSHTARCAYDIPESLPCTHRPLFVE
jgi:hypothetical protein